MIRSTVVLLLLFVLTVTLVPADTASEEITLPIELTEEERSRLDEIGKSHKSTEAPGGEIRNPAEWEPSVGVIIRYPLGISYSLVAEMSEDLVVTTIVSSSSQEATVRSYYQANNVNMANTDFIIAPTNSIWTRDYGPWFIYQDERLRIVDHIYNRPRPDDDVIPQVIGAEWSLPVYGLDLVTAGGNHMSDGLGTSMSTRLVYDENPSLTENEVDSLMLAYLGNEYTVLDYIESGGIHHIDCWAKFLDPATILVKDVPTGSSSHALLDARADFLSQQISAWGRPYEVIRIYCPYGTAYTNSIILNDKVLVPIFGDTYDDSALATYEQAMPGYEVIGFYGSWYDNDAIHCRTMGVPDARVLFIDHDPIWGVLGDTLNPYEVGAHISDYSRTGLITDSTLVRYRVNSGPWMEESLAVTPAPDSFTAFIPAQPGGSKVEYYLLSADNAGRVETHPYIGAPGAHSFAINIPPDIVSPDSFLCRAGGSFAFCPEIVDPDDSAHTITYSAYPDWLTVSNDTIAGSPPQSAQQTLFTVTVEDPHYATETEVTLWTYICGDLNNNGTGPDVSDMTFLVDYLFRGGSAPTYETAGNVDGQPGSGITVGDLTYLVDFLFRGGPEPVCE